ncbi:MAG: DUF4870 domain-containing protein [Candidatus Micrarchaeota archaeon]|nr:DUF4870 domain-containing protein [Candidatus Micrarchaeota archaeon]
MVDTFKKKTDFKKAEPKEARPRIAGKFLEDEKNKLRHDTGESEMVVPAEISKGPAEDLKKPDEGKEASSARWDLFLAYFFAPLGSLILYLLNKEERAVLHSKQSAVLWVISVFFWMFLLGWAVWLYGIFVGYKAAVGEDVDIPVISQALRASKDKP